MNIKQELRMKRYIILLVILLIGLFYQSNSVKAKTVVSASISAQKVKVGKRIQVTAKTSRVTYASSNSAIASVDSQGAVTGKKVGNVRIYVKKKGYKTKTLSVCVVKNGRKPPVLPVTLDEVSIKESKGTVTVSNNAKKGTIKRILYYYSVQTEKEAPNAASGSAASIDHGNIQTVKKTLIVTAKSISAGKTVTAIRQGDPEVMHTSLSQAKLTKIELYTGSALYVYDALKKTYLLQWGTKDTAAPKLTGLLKKKSYTGNGDIYRVCYSDKKNSYNFKQFVSATDDRDGKVKVEVDTSKINWKKEGVYRIYYRAEDRAGNVATSWAKLQVLIPGSAESAADQVLRSITRTGWSDTKKARAIYHYVRRHCAYVHSSVHSQWRTAALRGLRYQSGDCYTYYAICRLLLTRAGLPNVMIKRYPTHIGRHFWNLVYVQGGWYHFDTTPRSRGGTFCLRTDAQLWAYSSGYTFRFNQRLYPKRAVKKIR